MSTAYLDDADLWLLENDPTLAGKSARLLANRRRRENHKSGGTLRDEEIEGGNSLDSAEVAVDDGFTPVNLTGIARYRAERQLLASLTGCPTLAAAARRLGISRQAAHKTYSRLLKRAESRRIAKMVVEDRWAQLPGQPIPCLVGQQLDLFGGGR